MAHILIIDDEVQLCKALALAVTQMGHQADTAQFLSQGLKMLKKEKYEVVILDIRLPDGNGLEALPQIREYGEQPEVIILSGYTDTDGAELAIRSGAWSYIPKPPTLNKIRLPIQRAIEYHKEKKARRKTICLKRNEIVGNSHNLCACLESVAQAAGNEANVLIYGETGTGKELIAKAIHDNSLRSQGPFVIVDCAALPENLVESTLFGHEKGAFTGADRKTEGLVLQAHQGTLFLDEIGEMPIGVQKAFLRVVQERKFRSVGGTKEIKSNFRLVAATHRDLESMVATWKFRQDLLFRIRTINIEVPPLRQRQGDIKELALHFINVLCPWLKIPPKACSDEFMQALNSYRWPGNIRELMNVMESALTRAGQSNILYPRHLPTNLRVHLAKELLEEQSEEKDIHSPQCQNFPNFKDFKASNLLELEKQYMQDLMHCTQGNIKLACELSGLSRARVYALLKKHEVK